MKLYFYFLSFILLIFGCKTVKPTKINETQINKVNTSKYENKTNNITEAEKKQNPDKWINPFEGWKPTWKPGTYFTKNFPEHAWLDTIDYEDLKANGWIEKLNERENTENYLSFQGFLSEEFQDLLPEIPRDSINFYTAHWFGLNESCNIYNYKNSLGTKDSEKYISSSVYFRNLPIIGKRFSLSCAFKGENQKPFSFGARVYRNIDFENRYYAFDKKKILDSIELFNNKERYYSMSKEVIKNHIENNMRHTTFHPKIYFADDCFYLILERRLRYSRYRQLLYYFNLLNSSIVFEDNTAGENCNLDPKEREKINIAVKKDRIRIKKQKQAW